jgi:hypothetical protein
MPRRMFKKTVQQGRPRNSASRRAGFGRIKLTSGESYFFSPTHHRLSEEAFPQPYVEPLRDGSTQLAEFFNILLSLCIMEDDAERKA